MDEQGGVNLLPAFKSVIYNRLSPEDRESLHLNAATIRATHGEYTAAAYHYIRGGQAEKAIWLWYTFRQQEIDQGQGQAALALFAGLSRNQLDDAVKEVLVLLRSELRLLFGKYSEIKTDLYTTLWRTPLLKGRASRIEGDVAYEQSRFDESIRAYHKGLETVGTIGEELALFHKDIGKAYWQMRDLAQAWHGSLLARYEVEHLQGNIQEAMGNYAAARRYYAEALLLAQQLNFIEGEGRTRNNLAWVLLRQGEATAANQQWDKASDCYQRVGRLTWQAGIKINQAHYFKETGQPQAAIPLLESALTMFESLGHMRGAALANYHLAEAYLSWGNADKADHFAWQAVQKEEKSLKAANLNVLARIRLAQTRPVEAEAFCQKSIEAAEQNQDLLSCAYSWRALGEAYLAQEKIEEAKSVLEKAITIFQELDLPDEVEKTEAIVQEHHL
jgi:tetratricopeptide (TPR) repeat protein